VNDLTVLDNDGTTRTMALDSQTNGRLTLGRDFTVVRITSGNWLYNTTQFSTPANSTLLHGAGTGTDVFKFNSGILANTGFQFSWQAGRTDTSGIITVVNFSSSISVTSGSANFINTSYTPTWNQTGATGVLTGIDINPTTTNISGIAYGLRSRINTGFTGGGTAWNIYADGTAPNGFGGDLKLLTAGNGFYVKEGTNATMGTATLVAGTVTVNTTKVTANSRIYLTVQSLGTVAVATPIAITARVAGTSFTITSSGVTDTSVISWIIIEPS
jgi:hypothetical protein